MILMIKNRFGIRQVQPSDEFLQDLNVDGEFLKRLAGDGVDLLSFATRDFLPDPPAYSFAKVRDNVGLLRLNGYDGWLDQIGHSSRKHIRKAEKSGLTVIITNAPSDEMIDGVSRIYNETPVRQGRRFPHYGESFDEIKAAYQSGSGELHFVAFGREVVGFAQVGYGDRAAQIFQFLSMEAHLDKSPNNALLASVVKSCALQGYRYLIYGRMGLSHPTLTDFKRQNGFEECAVSRYLVPLSMKGRVACLLGLWREPQDMVPDMLKRAMIPFYSFLSRKFGV